MELAKVRVVIDRFNSDVQLMNVTPAQALLLQAIHRVNVTNGVIHDVRITGKDDKRTGLEEKKRLVEMYGVAHNKDGKPIVEEVFPGEFPKLPETFAEVNLRSEKPAKEAIAA